MILPVPSLSTKYLQALSKALYNAFTRMELETVKKVEGVAQIESYTVATVPDATRHIGLIYVSDETGGATIAFSDGTNWRRVQDRAVIS